MRTLILLCAAVAAVPALELDLRVGYGLRANSTDFTVSGTTDSDNWDSSNRVTVGAVIQPIPALVGTWLVGARMAFDFNEIGDDSYRNVALHLQGGYGFLLTPLVRLELMPYAGLGFADLDTAGNGSGSATSVEFGADVVVAVTLPNNFQLGAGIGYAWSTAEPSLDSGSVKIEQSGMVGSLFLGWRL